MTDVVLHHVADKQSGQEDTHYRIDQIKVVGFRRIEIIRQEVLYPVYDDFQYQCGECRKDTYKKTENQYEPLFLDILFAPSLKLPGDGCPLTLAEVETIALRNC